MKEWENGIIYGEPEVSLDINLGKLGLYRVYVEFSEESNL